MNSRIGIGLIVSNESNAADLAESILVMFVGIVMTRLTW